MAGVGDRLSLKDRPRVEIHVVDHSVIHGGVGRDLDARGRLEPQHAPPPRREDQDIRPAGDEPSGARGVEPRRIHEHQPRLVDPFGIADHVDQRRRARLGQRSERLLVDRGQAAVLVSGGRVIVKNRAEDPGVPFPPLDPVDEFFADLASHRATGEHMLRAIDFRGFAQNSRPALRVNQVGGDTQGGVGGDPRVSVGTAAFHREVDLRGGLRRAGPGIGLGQELMDRRHRRLDRLRYPPLLLNVDHPRTLGRLFAVLMRPHPAEDHQVVRLDDMAGVAHLATKPDQNISANIRVVGEPGEHSF